MEGKTIKKIIIIISIATVMLTAITSSVWLITQKNTITTGIQFIIVPDNTKAVVNNKSYIVNYETIIKTNPGVYHIKLSRDNFMPSEQDITVTGGKISKLYNALTPANNIGKQLISTDAMSLRLEQIGGYNSVNSPIEMAKKYPFTKNLPLVEKYFIITPCYGESGGQPIGICIMLAIDEPSYREQAKTTLQNNNIDFSNIPLYFYQG